MLLRSRRYFMVWGFLLLAAPLVVGLVAPDGASPILREGRTPAPAPKWPRSLSEIAALPPQVDEYLKDHFGLRAKMIRAHKDLTKPIIETGNGDVLVGRNGHLYLLNGVVQQSAGLVVRDRRVAESANLVAAMRDALAKRGIRFIVAVGPSSSTIDKNDLPLWAKGVPGRRTEYDLYLDDLASRGVRTVDLRPALNAARQSGKVYLTHDAHWTARGALVGFNAVVEADGHPEWRVDPVTTLGPPAEVRGGDLARLLGVQDDVTEQADALVLTQKGTDEILSGGPMPDRVVTTGRPGPTIMVIGDSFTGCPVGRRDCAPTGYFPLMLSQSVGRVIWAHHHQCGFDWRLIDRFRPDEVWWVPTERAIVCEPGQRPQHFDESDSR